MTPLPRILFITHAMGGGVEAHVADLRALLAPRAEIEVLRPAGPGAVTLQAADDQRLTWRCEPWADLVRALAARGYSRLHVHHIDGFPPQILELPAALGLPFDLTLHDYFAYCPRYQLSTPAQSYCGEPDAAACQACVERWPHAWGWSIRHWRGEMQRFVAQAQRVLAPTQFVGERLQKHFPDVPVQLRPHPPRAQWLHQPPDCTKVVVLGALSRSKGLETLLACAQRVTERGLALRLVLLGFPAQALPDGLPVQIRGEYADAELPALLVQERADALWFPGQFPETHSYTLDLALASGLPIIASDRGALGERLRGRPQARLLPADSAPDAWLDALHAVPGAPQSAWPNPAQGLQARQDYADFLCAALPPAPPAFDAERAQAAADGLATTVAPGTALSLAQLFEHGVLCGVHEPRSALQQRLVEVERDQQVLQGYEQRLGKPWFRILAEGEQDRAKLVEKLRQQKAQAAADAAEHQRSLAERQQELRAANQLAQARGDDLVRAVAQLREMESSRSWRVTAPIRSATLGARRWRNRLKRASSLARRGVQRLPMMLQILRTQGPRALVKRVRDKVQGQSFQPQQVAPTVLTQIEALQLATCPEDAQPRVSLVIPVYGQHLHTFNCLKSLGEHTDLSGVEVIVVDDASPEPAAEALKEVSGIRLLRNPQNLGFIGTCHHGADQARGDYLVLLNNDIQVTPGWLEALLDVFRLRADAGMVGARLVYPDGTLQEAGGIVWQDGSAWNWGRNGDPEHPMYRYLRAADYCSGACLALRRADWISWGGFDRHYAPAYYEDTDLAFRVRAAGKQVYYQPEARIVHFEGISSGTDETQGVKKHQVINRERFLERWHSTLQTHRPNAMQPQREVVRNARARALVIEACMITPDQDSGSVRMLAMLELLGELHCQVSFIADNLECRQPYARQLQQAGVEVWHYPYVHSVTQLLEQHGRDYDLILVCRHYIAAPLMQALRRHAPQARLVFDTVDLHYLREERKADLENSASMRAIADQTRTQELGVVRGCDVTLVVSPVEQALLATDAPGADVRILSNIHEPRLAQTGYAERHGLLFIGGFRHPPNIDAVEWFLAEVWPLVRAQQPDITVTIVGSHMPNAIQALAGPGVNILGYVPDVDPLIDAARVSIAPLRYGAGVKGKINQAMACGLPVVATAAAVEGMAVVVGEEILVADSAAEFAAQVLRLHGDAALWQRVAERGYDNIRQHFSRATAKNALAGLIDGL